MPARPGQPVGEPVSAPRPGGTREAAFAEHVLPHVALSLTGQSADAEDLVQDTLIRALRAVERFDGAHPRAWLLTVLRNTHLNRLRGRRPVLMREGESPEDHAGQSTPTTEDLARPCSPTSTGRSPTPTTSTPWPSTSRSAGAAAWRRRRAPR